MTRGGNADARPVLATPTRLNYPPPWGINQTCFDAHLLEGVELAAQVVGDHPKVRRAADDEGAAAQALGAGPRAAEPAGRRGAGRAVKGGGAGARPAAQGPGRCGLLALGAAARAGRATRQGIAAHSGDHSATHHSVDRAPPAHCRVLYRATCCRSCGTLLPMIRQLTRFGAALKAFETSDLVTYRVPCSLCTVGSIHKLQGYGIALDHLGPQQSRSTRNAAARAWSRIQRRRAVPGACTLGRRPHRAVPAPPAAATCASRHIRHPRPAAAVITAAARRTGEQAARRPRGSTPPRAGCGCRR